MSNLTPNHSTGFSGIVLRSALLVVATGLALSACASNRTNVPREAHIVAASESVILPPPGGPAILKVVTTDFPNAVRQDVWLETVARSTGENKISVIRFTDKGGDGSDAGLVDVPFTHVNLTAEALAAWPGSGMAVSPYFVQNDYGPFGYAIARPANGDTCLYAWQRIEPLLKPSGAVNRGSIVIRLQMCRQNATEESLLEVMYNLRLNTAVFPPNMAPARIGRNSAPIRPVGIGGFAPVIEVPKASPVATTTATPAVKVTVTPAIPAGAPIVPSPAGTGTTGVTVPSPTTGTGTSPTIPRPPTAGT